MIALEAVKSLNGVKTFPIAVAFNLASMNTSPIEMNERSKKRRRVSRIFRLCSDGLDDFLVPIELLPLQQ